MTLCQNSAKTMQRFWKALWESRYLHRQPPSPGTSFQNYSAPSGLVKIVRSVQGAAPLAIYSAPSGLKAPDKFWNPPAGGQVLESAGRRTSSWILLEFFYPFPFILYPCLYPCPFFSLFQNLICPVHRLIGCFYQLILLNCCIFRYLYHTFTLKITKYLYYRVFIY